MPLGIFETKNRIYVQKRTCAYSGCSAAWLARLTGGQKVGGSNPLIPTISTARRITPPGCFLFCGSANREGAGDGLQRIPMDAPRAVPCGHASSACSCRLDADESGSGVSPLVLSYSSPKEAAGQSQDMSRRRQAARRRFHARLAHYVELGTREQRVATALGCLFTQLLPARRCKKSGRRHWK